MWFGDDDVAVRRLMYARRKRSGAVLRVNSRKSAGVQVNRSKIWLILLGVLTLGGAVLLLLFLLHLLGGALFSHNDRFRIARLEIEAGPVINANLVREYTQLKEGLNLFGVDVRQVRRDFLARVPNVRSLTISRELPDTLRLQLTERTPLARVGWHGNLVVDREGVMFGLRSGIRGLPVITGYKAQRLMPGTRVDSLALAAVEVLDACDNPMLGLDIDVIETDKGRHLVVWLTDGRFADLEWKHMGEMTPVSRRNLMEKLNGWVNALQTPEGRRLTSFDATFEGRIYGR